MVNANDFVAYARLDISPAEDGSIGLCLEAAVSFARIAGIPPLKDCDLYDLFVYALALSYYDNRGFSPGVSVNANVQTSWVQQQTTALKLMLEYGAVEPAEEGGADGSP